MVAFLGMAQVALADEAAAGTRVTLNAAVEVQLANDEVVVTFRIEKEGRDADAVRKYVNRVSGAVQQRLEKQPGVRLKTLSRTMQPVWEQAQNRKRVRTGWRMTQIEQVISRKLDAVPGWLDAIEDAGAHLSGLQFRLSAEASARARDRLRKHAVALFRRKAAVIAKGLGAKQFRIIRLNAATQVPQPVVYRAGAMRAAAADAAPSLSAGEGMIRVNIDGEIEVPFIDFPVK